MQRKYKLAITIPTKNRTDVVSDVLKKLGKALYDRNIGFYIFDGSDTEELKYIVNDYIGKGFDNIHYFYYNPQQYDLKDNCVQRLYDSKRLADADYIWLCSDRFMPRKECLDDVFAILDKGYNVIVYNFLYRWGEITKEYYDKTAFFKECAPKLQVFIAPILDQSIMENYTYDLVNDCLKNNRYLEIEAIFRGVAKIEKFSALLLCFDVLKQNINLPLNINRVILSSHIVARSTFVTFIEKVYNTVSKLPEIYDSEKKLVMKNFSKYTWFSLEGFLKLRAIKGYDWKQCIKYMSKIHYVTDVPILLIFVISLLPPNVLWKIYTIIYKYKILRNQQYF